MFPRTQRTLQWNDISDRYEVVKDQAVELDLTALPTDIDRVKVRVRHGEEQFRHSPILACTLPKCRHKTGSQLVFDITSPVTKRTYW